MTQQDLGQMQMYVNYYQRELMNEGDYPPIGISSFVQTRVTRLCDIRCWKITTDFCVLPHSGSWQGFRFLSPYP